MTETTDNTKEKHKGSENLIPWKPGQSGNPKGRPKGSLSFITRIKKILEDNPEKFEELCQYYINDKRMRDLLLKMVDGMPKQNIEHGIDETIEEVNINIKGKRIEDEK